MTSPPTPPQAPSAPAPGAGGKDAPTGAGRHRAPRVLVARLSAIGDVLHALPAVVALRRARPAARLVWVVEDRAATVLLGHPALDRVVVLPRRRWTKSLRRVAGWPGALREAFAGIVGLLGERFDAAIDFQGNLKSGLVVLASGAPARYGFATEDAREGNGFFVNRRVGVRPRGRHRVERNLALVAAFLGEPVAFADPALPLPPDGGGAVDAALARAGLVAGEFVVLHPGTSGFGAFKRWPPGAFARLADRILEATGRRVALTWGPGEESLVEEVRAAAAAPPVLLPTPSLAALAQALRRAACFVSGDTGPLHVAAAVGTPLLGLFGPKDERVYGPYGRRRDGTVGALPVLVREDVPCRPCPLRWCPEPVCLSAIEVEDVLDRVRACLSGTEGDRAGAHRAGARTGG